MIKFLNKTTGEQIVVNSCKMISATEAETLKVYTPKAKFYESNPMFIFARTTDEGKTVFTIADGYEIVSRIKGVKPNNKPTTAPTSTDAPVANDAEPTIETTTAKPRKPRKPRKPTASNTASNDVPTTDVATNDVPAPAPAPAPESAPTDEAQPVASNDETPTTDAILDNDDIAVIMALKRMKRIGVDEYQVADIVEKTLRKLAKTQPDVVEAAMSTVSLEDEIFVSCFNDIVEDVKDGFYPYMEGAAGCGKSYTAEQVARALGLKFYPMQQVIMAHQIEGYGDAAGNYVPTPVYEAFAYGGLVFFDEWDGSHAEAAIVVNNMLANGEYSFPVIGRVKAHPNFRCIFAGNTVGKGADEEYTGRDVLDGSTRDRLIHYHMTYDRRVELIIAHGDVETVDFMEDMRRAVAKTGIRHIVSYRATKYAVARKNNMEAALRKGIVKFLENDEMRLIYEALENKESNWAKAFKRIIK